MTMELIRRIDLHPQFATFLIGYLITSFLINVALGLLQLCKLAVEVRVHLLRAKSQEPKAGVA